MRERRTDDIAMPNFTSDFDKLTTTKEGQAQAINALRTIMEIIDEAVEKGDCYMTIGTSRGAKKAMCTVTEGSNKTYAVGATLAELLQDWESL